MFNHINYPIYSADQNGMDFPYDMLEDMPKRPYSSSLGYVTTFNPTANQFCCNTITADEIEQTTPEIDGGTIVNMYGLSDCPSCNSMMGLGEVSGDQALAIAKEHFRNLPSEKYVSMGTGLISGN